ncbi:MAG: carboxypeptidase regulatory-like domain-containing protein [Clostridia bacterium]|nr:carboxypeptidase regulatory-like domain-containing protein [Clostridia bacterium]
MKNRLKRMGAALCAGLMLLASTFVYAEERHLGSYIYVPAMNTAAGVGSISLRVEGEALQAQSDQPVYVSSLAGARFGVYVVSEDGELKPWANPLYPSEQMRILTGEGETTFSLPQGITFYLIQESAPQGYLFDEMVPIPVEGDEILVTNRMPGELVLCAEDSLGQPLEGVSMQAVGEDGEVYYAVTDANGEAVIRMGQAGLFEVSQTALPENAFEPIRTLINGEQTQGARAQVHLAQRTRVTFVHPASGSVELQAVLTQIDENGKQTKTPLSGVTMEILGDAAQTVRTDENGFVSLPLLENVYEVRFGYDGNEEIELAHTGGQLQVVSGARTVIELEAARLFGRVVVSSQCERETKGGSVAFEDILNGTLYGPYAFDVEASVISEEMPAGQYRIAQLTAPDNTQCGALAYDGMAYADYGFTFSIEPGKAAELSLELLTMEKQTYSLYAQRIDDLGEIAQEVLSGAHELTLIDADGEEVSAFAAENGAVQVEALSGEYRMRMDEAMAQQWGITPVSEPFVLPGDEESIRFAANGARLILMSVDENGEPVFGATYSILDSAGNEYVVKTDGEAQGVTPLLAVGEMRIESIVSPANHDEAQVMTVAAPAGQATMVQVVHPAYGVVNLKTYVQRVNARGETQLHAMPGASVKLYSIEDDAQTLIDTELSLVSLEDGTVSVQLKPGSYVAQIDAETLPDGYSEGSGAAFNVSNTQSIEAQLVCMDALGGISIRLTGGELSEEEMAQVRFETVDDTGVSYALTLVEGMFCASGLPEGQYTLRQTQIPQGYTLAKEMAVKVYGGSAAQVAVPLEEYAVLTVEKHGITFNDRMQTYLVPLSGEYGVFVGVDGGIRPYPSEDEQMTVWANVTPEQIAQGRTSSLRLPAAVDGTTYYIKEIGGAAGFTSDHEYHEVTLCAGETAAVSCTVSSDRGFFTFSQTDAATGEHIAGGEFELIDNASNEPVLSFTLGEEQYRNAMAVPVGDYTLRQIRAGEGYAMSEPAQCAVFIEPYLTQGGTVTHAAMTSARIPQGSAISAIGDLYAADQEGLTFVMVEGASLAAGETLQVPQMTLRIAGEDGSRTDIGSVILSGVTDAFGGKYQARVEYCLQGGGWQPSDARMTGELSAPVCISLADVEDDISAVRITYIHADTGEEKAESGFNPGQVSLNAEIGAEDTHAVIAEVSFTGEYAYTTRRGGETQLLSRSERRELQFEAAGQGVFTTVSAGRDGRITGVVFFDEDADGVMDAAEQARYAGMTVSLMTPALDLVSSCRTDGSGRYEFSGISGGEYVLQFEAGDKLVFSSGEGYTEHVISGIDDKQYGVSGVLRFDGDHSDYVVNAGCIYAAQANGRVTEKTAEGKILGYEGLMVEFMPVGSVDEEPVVVMTDADGMFGVTRILPGEYDVRIELSQNDLCEKAVDGVIKQRITVAQGEKLDLGQFTVMLKATVSGSVYVDADGDGAFSEGSQAVSGVKVTLLKHIDGHTEAVAWTHTDESGAYFFDNLYDGEYSVLFELEDGWTFTRFGQDSKVYGAVSTSGSTQSFKLLPGTMMEHISAGATIPAKLEVFVFADEHADGQKGAYDEGLDGVVITLIRQENGQDAEQISMTTGSDGFAIFDGLAPGEYVLAYQMPGIYRATKQVTSELYPTSFVPQTTLSSGRSEVFALAMGENNERRFIGAMLSGQISGTVYHDNDADARIAENEPGCSGVLVELLGADGAVLDTRMTGEDGQYVFDGLAPGRYTVRFTAQAECGFSGSERSMTRGGVQKSDSSVSQTRQLTVTAGSKLNTAHAGIVRLAGVSGFLFEDSNADRVMDETERRLSGVTVHLMNGSARNILMSTVTDENGRYSFDRITPGVYLIRMDAPQGYAFSGAEISSPLSLNNMREGRGYSAAFELLGGAQANDLNFGLLTQGTIRGRVWIDEDFDGCIGENEEGMRGAVITLSDMNGNEIAKKNTIRSGEFAFDGLLPGEYVLSIVLNEGYVFTAGGSDSLIDRVQQETASLYLGSLEMGGTMDGIAIGALRPASVSGVVWLDENNDGRREEGDAGVSGVHVTLTMNSGKDAGKSITTKTDEQGGYRFDGVMPGEAQLSFEIADGYGFAKKVSGARRVSCVPMSNDRVAHSAAFGIVSGASVSGMDVGVLPVGSISGRVWQDAQYDGRINADEAGVSGARVVLLNAADGAEVSTAQTDENGEYRIGYLRPGAYTLRFVLPDGMIFTREGDGKVAMVDASSAETERLNVSLGQSFEGMNAGAIVPASITGSVMIDANENDVIDSRETGLSGAVITVMQGGTVVTSEKTLEDGTFAINSLRPGTYRIRVALTKNMLFSRGVNLTVASADAQEGETDEITLSMGQLVETEAVAAVRAAQISGKAWLDANTDGRIDAQEEAMKGVYAELLDENGTVLASKKTGDNGEYRFDLLRSGNYAVRFTLGSGVLFADQTGEAGESCVPPVNGSVSTTDVFAVRQGENVDWMNIGGILPCSIGDTVFLDVNGNGMMDYREPQLSGVELELMRVSAEGEKEKIASVISDAYGYYAFGDLRPGSYVLRVVLEEGDVLTKHIGAPLSEIDSDADPQTGETDVMTILSGQTIRNVDFGFTAR